MDQDSAGARLRWARTHQGKYDTPTDAARAYGWTVSTYLGHENGDRQPSLPAAKRYARAYGVRWEWLLENDGTALPKGPPPVKIIGKVDAGGVVVFYQNEQFKDCDEQPPHAGIATRALEAGAALRGVAESGWLYFFDDEEKVPTRELMGKLCVVDLKSGEVLIRTIQPGRKKGRYDLESTTEPTLRDQQVVWAARISWIKPR